MLVAHWLPALVEGNLTLPPTCSLPPLRAPNAAQNAQHLTSVANSCIKPTEKLT